MNNDRFDEALKEAVTYFKKFEYVKGILVSGSYVSKQLNKNSDLDLFILIDDIGHREKGIKVFNDIDVEYFLQPYDKIIDYFNVEETSSKCTTLSLFDKGKIIYDENNEMRELVKIAKKKIKKKLPKLTKMQIDMSKYFLEDYLKDMKYAKKEVKTLIEHKLFEEVISVFFAFERQRIPKEKYLLSSIEQKDFKDLLEKYLKTKKYEELEKLALWLLEYIGGPLPREYVMRIKTK